MDHFQQKVKETIQKILFCSGEPFAASESCVELLYEHIRKIANSIRSNLPSKIPKLHDVLLLCRDRPIQLNRIARYYNIVSRSFYTKESNLGAMKLSPDDETNLNDTVYDDGDGELYTSQLCWKQVSKLCKELNISLPTEWELDNLSANKVHSQILKGRRLRLARIDSKACCVSADDYLSFSQLRQSASFLSLSRGRYFSAFQSWFFCFDTNSSDCEQNTVDENHIQHTERISREVLDLLAYLLTGDVLDVIDIVLYNRVKLKIDLSSPLTPVEVKGALKNLSSIVIR